MKRINIKLGDALIASGVSDENDLKQALDVALATAELFEGAKIEIVDGDAKTLIDDIRAFKEELDRAKELAGCCDDYDDWEDEECDDEWDDDEYDDDYDDEDDWSDEKSSEDILKKIRGLLNGN